MENGNNEEILGQEVDELLEQGLSQKEIEARGYSPSLVRQRVRKRIKAGKAAPLPSGRDGTLALRKERESVLPEWVAAQLDLFDGSERDKRIFMSGMAVPLMGLRLFAEAVGPLVALLATWQKGQADAARAAQQGGAELAQQAAQQTLNGAMPQILDMVKRQAAASSPNPFQTMVADAMRPYLHQTVASLMGAFRPMGRVAQLVTEQGSAPGSQLQAQVPPGSSQATKDEVMEAFNE